MQNIICKLKEALLGQKVYYFIVLLFFCTGLVIGVYTVSYMDGRSRNDLLSYFGNFSNGMGEMNVDYGELLILTLKKNLFLIIPVIILSFTFFGSIIILIIDLIKGFTLGYTFTFLLSTFEGNGLTLALASTIPQNLIYIPCYISLSVIGIYISTNCFRERFFKRYSTTKLELIKGLTNFLFIILVFFSIGLIVETYVCPSIIKFVLVNFYS